MDRHNIDVVVENEHFREEFIPLFFGIHPPEDGIFIERRTTQDGECLWFDLEWEDGIVRHGFIEGAWIFEPALMEPGQKVTITHPDWDRNEEIMSNILRIPPTWDMFDLLVHLGFFPSKGQARKNWKPTGAEIPLGFNEFVFGKMNHVLTILNPRPSSQKGNDNGTVADCRKV